MRFEALLTDRLLIRRLGPNDAQTLSGYRGNPKVARFQTAYSSRQAEKLIEEMSKSDPSATGRWFQFGLELRAEKQLIGDIGFLNTDEHQKSWLGFTLDPMYWGRGYATEAVQTVLAHYQKKLGIDTIWASTDPENHASMKLLRRLGFSLVDEKPNDRVFVLKLSTDRIP